MFNLFLKGLNIYFSDSFFIYILGFLISDIYIFIMVNYLDRKLFGDIHF